MQNSNHPSEVLYWLLREQPRWHVGEPSATTRRLDGRTVVIIGINAISSRLAAALSLFGWNNCQVVDEARLRNHRLVDGDGRPLAGEWPAGLNPVLDHKDWEGQIDPASLGCVVACSDCGEIGAIRDWNRFCVERKIQFFPLVLQNLIGNVGPFVVPGETACYECVHARQNSHLEDPASQRAALALVTRGQSSTGFHVAMASLVGDIAACELFKFYSDAVPERNTGKLILANLLDTRLEARKVLKIPRCVVCSPLNTRSSMTPFKPCPSPESLADT